MRLPALLALGSLLLTAAAPRPANAPQRWAVIVGISDYANFGDEIGGDLPGSVNDARSMSNVLQARWGFDPQHVRLLLDRDASRTGIKAELTERLPAVVQPNDLVVFYFAGHGSQAWDLNGDEADGLDETLAPYDAQRGSTESDITDDELAEWIQKLPTRNVTVILDNCHAGTGTRAVTPFARPRSLNRRINDLPRPGGTRSVGNAARPEIQPTNLASNADVLEIAAAQADQVAMDVAWPDSDETSHTWGGAFTTILARYLWEVPVGTTYIEVFALTREELKRKGFAQDPVMTSGASQQRLAAFTIPGGAASEGTPFAVLAASGPAAVEVTGGSAAGLTPGSLLAAGDRMLRITQVQPDRARAELVGGSSGMPAAGAPLQLAAFRYPETKLRVSVVDLPAPARAALRQAMAGAPDVMLTEGSQTIADLIIRPVGSGYQVLGMDGAVRHTVPAADQIGAVLQQEQGARRLAALENPARPFALDFTFANGRQTFRIGEPIQFRVRSARDGYLTVVDLGTDGTVSVLYPNESERDGRVHAGQQIVLPTPAMDVEFTATPPAGRGIVRAIVTERPLALPTTEGVTQAEAVERAIRAAAGTSPLQNSDAVPVNTWTTASMVYTVTP